MTEKKEFRAIKGTRDILPAGPDYRQAGSELWNWFEEQARETFEKYGFRDIRTPILEQEELFARSIGTETDIVSKEMFRIEDQPVNLPNPRAGILTPQGCEQLEQAMARGEIPNTNTNRDVLLSLKQLIAKTDLLQMNNVDFGPFIKDYLFKAQFLSLGDPLALRPEGTAGVCRAYIEHGMQTLPGNQKLYYMGPMFRRERPQKGRYRQFYQIGAEVLGQSDAPGIDAELIEMLLVFFRSVGLKKTKLQVNSIGCKECRAEYVEKLRLELYKVHDQLGADSQRRIETNPLRVLDSKVPEEQEVIEKLPRISEHLCADCRAHFEALKVEMKFRGIEWEENWRLVRGLDYYTRTTFEVTAEGLGSQNAVCGGGRYDGLVEMLGGPPTKGIGFAIGSDRVILSIQETGDLPDLPRLAVFVAWMGEKAYLPAIRITRKLREAGVSVELPAEEMKFKKSLGLADKLGARYALILGEDELASGQYALKNLSNAKQDKFDENMLLEYLESERRGTRA